MFGLLLQEMEEEGKPGRQELEGTGGVDLDWAWGLGAPRTWQLWQAPAASWGDGEWRGSGGSHPPAQKQQASGHGGRREERTPKDTGQPPWSSTLVCVPGQALWCLLIGLLHAF